MSKLAAVWSTDRQTQFSEIPLSTVVTKPAYQLVDGGPGDYKKVMELFMKFSPSGYALSKVEIIYNPALEESFNSVVQSLIGRDDDKSPVSQTQESPSQTHFRDRVKRLFDQETKKYTTKAQRVVLLPLFHGTQIQLLENVCKTGYQRPENDRIGLIGTGIYHSNSARLAYQVHGTGLLVLNWIASKSPFIGIASDFPLRDAKVSDFVFSPVHPLEPANLLEKVYCPLTESYTGDIETYEGVVLEPIQILPRYLLTLNPEGLNLKEVNPQFSKAMLLVYLMDLKKQAKGELQKLVEKMGETLKKDLTGELSMMEKWLLTHSLELLKLKEGTDPKIRQVLFDQIEQILRLEVRALSLQPSPDSETDPDYVRGLKLINSKDFADYPGAFKCFLAATKKRIVPAFYQVGMCFKTGKGVEKKDDLKAFQNFLLAAEQGHTESEYLVGQYYKIGILAEKDFKKAIKYTLAAAKKDHPEALDYLGHCYLNGYTLKKDIPEALKCFKRAAALGNQSSQFYLAQCYRDGTGVKQDEEKTFELFKSLADQGNSTAQYEVSQCFKLGKGVGRNFLYSVKYALLAAASGHEKAMEYIGHCYFHGYTLPQNMGKAFEYFQLSALLQNPSALEYMGICYEEAKGVDKNPTKAIEYYLVAADLGMKESQYRLGVAFKEGMGVPQDWKKAKFYFGLAAKQGVKKAQEQLDDADNWIKTTKLTVPAKVKKGEKSAVSPAKAGPKSPQLASEARFSPAPSAQPSEEILDKSHFWTHTPKLIVPAKVQQEEKSAGSSAEIEPKSPQLATEVEFSLAPSAQPSEEILDKSHFWIQTPKLIVPAKVQQEEKSTVSSAEIEPKSPPLATEEVVSPASFAQPSEEILYKSDIMDKIDKTL